ncbi:MAG: polyamine aminopropyltransferase [Clostridia bacterium]|nr:polyamine aminopropyltransferase [Clostridia bacterium]MCL6521396.1 polyamine aminopropyltransferase [Bacillota bacterium]
MNAWFTEEQTRDMRLSLRVRSLLHRERSGYQEIAVYETAEVGRLLVLDDVIMTSERDEFGYHEMISHVALCTHPAPRRVLIIGGGDGGTLREVARHREVEEIHMVEIDERVIEVSRRFLPSIAAAFDDPRLRLHIDDGIEYVRAAAEKGDRYDVILCDSTDPVGPAAGLFSADFFRNAAAALGEEGLYAAQTESPYFNRELLSGVQRDLREAFGRSYLYLSAVPTYPGGLWSFSMGSKGPDPTGAELHFERVEGMPLRFYSPEVHRAAFALPPFVRELLPGEARGAR